VTDSKGRRSENEPDSKIECNPFLALCKLASKESWCWNLTCTTCGNMHFRYAFKELAKGKHPDKFGWIVNNRMPVSGFVVKVAKSFSEKDQETLSRLVLDVSIEDIKKASKAPDWLGYLGLVLVHCSNSKPQLSKSWAPQFLEILPPYSSSYNMMEEIQRGVRLFHIGDLEKIETALYR
jgi:hypothetical protein